MTLAVLAAAATPAPSPCHLLPEELDAGLQVGLREANPASGRDPDKKHGAGASPTWRELPPASGRRVLGLGARRLRGAGGQNLLRQRGRPGQQGRFRRRWATTPSTTPGAVPGPGTGRLRADVEHALHGANKLGPAQWADLTKPVYFGHVAMSSTVAFRHHPPDGGNGAAGEGGQGWSRMLQIAGNCAAITERSFGVPDGSTTPVRHRPVIDFSAWRASIRASRSSSPTPVTAVVPATSGSVAGGKNAAEARKFIAYTVSAKAKELLLDPKISRPADPAPSHEGKLPAVTRTPSRSPSAPGELRLGTVESR